MVITEFLRQKMAPSATPKIVARDGHPGSFFLVSKVKMPMHEDLHEGWFHNTHRPGWYHKWLQPKKNTKNEFWGSPNTWICLFFSPRGVWRMEVRVRCFIFQKTPRLCLSLEDNVRKSEPPSSKSQISLDVAPRSEDIFSLQAGLALEN